MAHDPAVVDIKRGGRRPGAGLVLANFLYFDNTHRTVHAPRVVRLRHDFRFMLVDKNNIKQWLNVV